MANQDHLDILRQGVDAWNEWRKMYPDVQPNLTKAPLGKANLSQVNFSNTILTGVILPGAELSGANFSGAIFNGTNLGQANLTGANFDGASLYATNLGQANLAGAHFNEAVISETNLGQANLTGADLCRVCLKESNLSKANLSGANLSGANLAETNLKHADLSGADLTGANLSGACLSDGNFTHADLTGCRIYAISAWNVQLERTIQSNLIITHENEPTITVDNLEVAQFIYLLLNNPKICNVLDTITSKVVLILGNFAPKRKAILDTLRSEFRKRDYSPVVFDFEQPASRNLTETVSTLAHLSRFIVADLTEARSVPQELERIVPRLRVPVQSLLHVSEKEAYALFRDFSIYPWVLPLHRYNDESALLQSLDESIINSVEQKVYEMERRILI